MVLARYTYIGCDVMALLASQILVSSYFGYGDAMMQGILLGSEVFLHDRQEAGIRVRAMH